MGKKKVSVLVLMAALMMLVGVIGVFGPRSSRSGMKVGPEEIVVQAGPMAPVLVPHRRHQKDLGSCEPCHGFFPKQVGVISKMKREGKLKKREIMGKCLQCHKDRKAAGRKAGPTKCSQCHLKRLKG